MEANAKAPRAPIALTQYSRAKQLAYIALTVGAVVFCFWYLEVSPVDLVTALPQFLRFFVENFLPPNFAVMPQYVPYILETVMFAVAGTYFSAILAFFLGLLMCEEMNSIRWLRGLVRGVVSFLRNVPFMVWASLLIYIFGIGNLVGLIALVFATLGFLGRTYAESIQEVAGSKLEAIRASGASKAQVIWHGLIPAFVPAWVNWTLFSFEINIRASAVLGMVGAGGVGIMIQTNIRLFKYNEAFSLILVLLVLILATELITNTIRKRIR